ncbi:hypothetical protein DN585_12645 [Intrasporangium calvum]|nr:hypothetical protein DN585_12645 [Intrasporangium calvum]
MQHRSRSSSGTRPRPWPRWRRRPAGPRSAGSTAPGRPSRRARARRPRCPTCGVRCGVKPASRPGPWLRSAPRP